MAVKQSGNNRVSNQLIYPLSYITHNVVCVIMFSARKLLISSYPRTRSLIAPVAWLLVLHAHKLCHGNGFNKMATDMTWPCNMDEVRIALHSSYSTRLGHDVWHSLGRADIKLRHAKEKINENTHVHMCVAKRAHKYAGEKGDDFCPSPAKRIGAKHNFVKTIGIFKFIMMYN